MTRSQNKGSVGDRRSPTLRPIESGLREAAEQAEEISAETSETTGKFGVLGGLACAVKASSSIAAPSTTCRQILWFSFFFDGTGNNMYADEGMLKHSNVAKLFRVHKAEDSVLGIYPIYIPGVGTYFSEVGDDGGSDLGLGCGAMGEARLDHALRMFDTNLLEHLKNANSPGGAIVEINIAAFGFSRGAALARAFINLLLEKRCKFSGGKWELKDGRCPVRLRFLGIFDTVASVGVPMSGNTTSVVGTVVESVRYMIQNRLTSYHNTRPEVLAYHKNARPGADPAPGKYDGHKEWGSRLEIDELVEEVRHFIAAHEIRNSFPLDSVSILKGGRIAKPVHFYETVYPGVHSDVGGSYCPGEGARSPTPQENLGLIPLMHMYKFAMLRGVPLLPECAWRPHHFRDFEVDPALLRTYDYYLGKVGTAPSLGHIIQKNMRLFFAWRFRAIHLKIKGHNEESGRIALHNDKFTQQGAVLDVEIATLAKEEEIAMTGLKSAVTRRQVEEIKDARENHRSARDALLKAKARRNAVPNMQQLEEMLGMYDRQLMADVKAIKSAFFKQNEFGDGPLGRGHELRPHYRLLLETYENEFVKSKGLTDATIIRFFDEYVHDSLAGFAKDATIPSDPRVVYLGGNQKYEYARLDQDNSRKDVELGFA